MLRSKEDIKLKKDNLPKRVTNWIARMEETLAAMPSDVFLSADGSLHLFSKFKDGSIFKECTGTRDGLSEANESAIHRFDVYCEGGDFW